MTADNTKELRRPELIFAVVGAAGTRLDKLSTQLEKTLEQFGYQIEDIRLSDLLNNFDERAGQKHASEFERITHLQEVGNAFRNKLQDGAALARAGIAMIRERRAAISQDPDKPAPNRAYILQQLKHPDQVDLLREVYGSAFLLVAGHAITRKRTEELANLFARSLNERLNEEHRSMAHKVIGADEKQADDFGQNTRDTYPKADFFANLTDGVELFVGRFVELLFGHPFLTPLPDEYAMYQARAASLRSSDDNRQVGAAIANVKFGSREQNADVIAIGMNEVPRAGGGAYWQDDSVDARDQALLLDRNIDRAKEIKTSALAELIERMRDRGLFNTASAAKDPRNIASSLLKLEYIKGTQFMDIGEFSRPVHAEMAALIDAARRGVAVDGETMYVTTFPCHNCAKHIIASGIKQVVYLEPYPKSRASDLYDEDINLEPKDRKTHDKRVAFFAFSGIAPRQYEQLFSMSARGAKKGSSLKKWEDNRLYLSPLYISRHSSFAYVHAEREELEKLPTKHYKWDKGTICPAVH